MTPADCLKATPAELAPIVAEMMGEGWYVADLGTFFGKAFAGRPGVHRMNMSFPPREPWSEHHIADAFRLQDRVAELGLQHRFGNWLYCVVTDHGEEADSMGMAGYLLDYGHDKWDFLFTVATASPLSRTRAACAVYLESKEPK